MHWAVCDKWRFLMFRVSPLLWSSIPMNCEFWKGCTVVCVRNVCGKRSVVILASENNTINATPSIQRKNVSFLSIHCAHYICSLPPHLSYFPTLLFAEIKSSDFTTLFSPSTSNSPESDFIIAFLSCNLFIVLTSTYHCRVYIDMDMAKQTQKQLHSHSAICVNAIATVAFISTCAIIRYVKFVVVYCC